MLFCRRASDVGQCVVASVTSLSSLVAVALVWIGSAIVLTASPAFSQFTSFSHDPRNILEGNWQSCREADGRYSERVYDHVVNGVPRFEVHMGPRREFAIFEGVQDEHRAHESPANLLRPYYRLDVEGNLRRSTNGRFLRSTWCSPRRCQADRAAIAKAGTCCSSHPRNTSPPERGASRIVAFTRWRPS